MDRRKKLKQLKRRRNKTYSGIVRRETSLEDNHNEVEETKNKPLTAKNSPTHSSGAKHKHQLADVAHLSKSLDHLEYIRRSGNTRELSKSLEKVEFLKKCLNKNIDLAEKEKKILEEKCLRIEHKRKQLCEQEAVQQQQLKEMIEKKERLRREIVEMVGEELFLNKGVKQNQNQEENLTEQKDTFGIETKDIEPFHMLDSSVYHIGGNKLPVEENISDKNIHLDINLMAVADNTTEQVTVVVREESTSKKEVSNFPLDIGSEEIQSSIRDQAEIKNGKPNLTRELEAQNDSLNVESSTSRVVEDWECIFPTPNGSTSLGHSGEPDTCTVEEGGANCLPEVQGLYTYEDFLVAAHGGDHEGTSRSDSAAVRCNAEAGHEKKEEQTSETESCLGSEILFQSSQCSSTCPLMHGMEDGASIGMAEDSAAYASFEISEPDRVVEKNLLLNKEDRNSNFLCCGCALQ